MDISNVSGIRNNLWYVNCKSVASILSIEIPRLEGLGYPYPTRNGRKENNNSSFILGLGADGYAMLWTDWQRMNAVTNVQQVQQWLGYLTKRTPEGIQKRAGLGITFDGSIGDCDCDCRKLAN